MPVFVCLFVVCSGRFVAASVRYLTLLSRSRVFPQPEMIFLTLFSLSFFLFLSLPLFFPFILFLPFSLSFSVALPLRFSLLESIGANLHARGALE